MDVRQLRCVEAVARHRHFTRAAEELHVAQSALSHQVQRLETELGIVLFERTSRRVTPTEAGLTLAARARRVLAELDLAHEELDQLRGVQRGRIRLGLLVRAGQIDVAGLLANFSRRHPGIEVSLREGLAHEMLQQLADGELDATFCLGSLGDEVDSVQLGEDEIVAAFQTGSAPPADHVGEIELRGRRLMGGRRESAVIRHLDGRFAPPLRFALETGDHFVLRSLAARGFGAAIMPRSLTEIDGPAVEVRGFDPPAMLPAALAWRRDRRPSPAAQTFIDFVRGG